MLPEIAQWVSPDEMRASICQESLREFAIDAWHTVEPKTRFVQGWHLDAICDHLEAITHGDIHNLVINMPPRHMKSLLVSVFWPAWVWTTRPDKRWIFGSYNQNLSKRDSVKTRRVIESAWYQRNFGHVFKMAADQNEKMRFENDKAGQRLAVGVGSGTGEGADYMVADDPHKTDEIESKAALEKAIEWWDGTASTRANDPKNFGKVIVMQRITDKDLSGHVLAKGGYEHLCLPAEYRGKKYHTSVGFEDPRTRDGELLWPERFDDASILELKKSLGSHRSEGQLQQDPVAVVGGLFKRQWWQRYREAPHFDMIVQIWDTAQKAGITNDYSVCATWGITKTGFYLIDIWRNKVEAPQLENAAMDLYVRFPDVRCVVVEDKNSGSSLIQHLKQKTRMPVLAYNPESRDKEVRASAATPTVESGKCYLPEDKPFVEDFILEHEKFPNVENDDQVDTTSMLIDLFNRPVPQQPRITFI